MIFRHVVGCGVFGHRSFSALALGQKKAQWPAASSASLASLGFLIRKRSRLLKLIVVRRVDIDEVASVFMEATRTVA